MIGKPPVVTANVLAASLKLARIESGPAEDWRIDHETFETREGFRDEVRKLLNEPGSK
jgi:hypothetical protein